MSGLTSSRNPVRRAKAGTTEAPWVRYTLIGIAMAFLLLLGLSLVLLLVVLQVDLLEKEWINKQQRFKMQSLMLK